MGSDMAVGQWGPAWPVTAHRTMGNQSFLLMEEKKEWEAEKGEREHLCVQNKAFSCTGKVAPGAAFVRATPMEGESAPKTQPHCPVPWGREGQHYLKLNKNVSNGVSIFPPAVPPSAFEHQEN